MGEIIKIDSLNQEAPEIIRDERSSLKVQRIC